MPKVRPQIEHVYNEDLGGVRVTIQLYDPRPNVTMVVSLPYACAWQGKLVPRMQSFVTDDQGQVIVRLPPSDELKPLAGRQKETVAYKLECEPVGKLAFVVPNVPEWTLGA